MTAEPLVKTVPKPRSSVRRSATRSIRRDRSDDGRSPPDIVDRDTADPFVAGNGLDGRWHFAERTDVDDEIKVIVGQVVEVVGQDEA
jgi:hypothetical protein